ncbi:MAG: hypothetical protein R3Y63_12275 [Eubacteriales bacterium]
MDNVGVFSNFFAPTQEYWIEDTSSEWVRLEEELHFDSRFYQKSVVNNIHSVSPVELRIVSPTGELVVDHLQLSQGEKATLEELENYVEYEIFAKSEGEFNYLLFT